MWPLLLLALASLCVATPGLAQQVASCAFNSMCACKAATPHAAGDALGMTSDVKDISCVGVPFSRLPALPSGQVTHMDVVNSGLEALDHEALGDAQIESLRLMSNKIQHLGERTFSGMTSVLKSLDLSYNELDEVPFEALRSLQALDWLNLHSNQISTLVVDGHDWSHMRATLTNVFLGENDLTELPRDKYETLEQTGNGNTKVFHHQSSLSECVLLAWLNVDNNKIAALEQGSLPPSLQTLSASQNLIARFPAEALDGLKELAWLYLRGNYLEDLPEYTFRHRLRLDKLDLGENALLSIPNNLFNGSMTVRDLNLDFNYLKTLPAQAFRGMNVGRLYLAMNELETIDDRAFVGLGHTLEFLDLEHNQLMRVPKALSQLKRLKYLYAPSNRIAGVEDDAFDAFAASLRALSLSGNQLTRMPSEALRECKKLSHLNIGYNQIREVHAEDFARWGVSLDTLLLRNNRISRLDSHVFRETPRLRELSLSFNRLTEVAVDAFVDVAGSLESLEASFGVHRDDFPDDFLRPLTALRWLALDNNAFRSIAANALYPFGQLQYLNLEANRLAALPDNLFHAHVHKNLRDVRLSYNHLEAIEPETFAGLADLQTAVLTGNRIRIVQTNAFRSLPSLATLILSSNQIDRLEPRAFTDLPSLVKLDLQNNALRELSLSAFANVTALLSPLSLNASCNHIAALHASDTGLPLHLKTLDLSHNRVPEVPVNFLQSFAASLRRLHLGHNRVSRLDAFAFGALGRLEVLAVEHNRVASIAARAFEGLDALQLLDLSHNRVDALRTRQFAGLEALRIVDLSHNGVRSAPRDAFAGTRLERLDLSHNAFVAMPSAALSEVGRTLRYLQISHNLIEHLDSTMFPHTPALLGLDLAHNRLAILSDNVFTSLGGLLSLDLSANPIRANFKELFHYVQRLRHLSLADTGLNKTPILPLPNLVALNLSGNAIEAMSATSVEGLERLRSLHLRGNRLHAVPSHCWPLLPLLKTLDISKNPLKIITKESFAHLPRLQHLDVSELPRLERFDADTLSRLRILTSLRIETWPRIEKYRFRLGSVLSGVPSLRKLAVRLQETALTDQLLGAFNTKLRHLEITGENLRRIDADAFEGVEHNYELALQIRGTQLEALPGGLFAKLAHIPHLSLDLRDNRFHSLSSATLYADANHSSWEDVGTKLVSGGLVLKGNPWTCDCGLVWLGHWLRRWLRETLQIHTVVLEGAQQMQALAREATCADPRTGQQTPILELHAEDLACHASALSGVGVSGLRGSPLARTWWSLVVGVLVWSVW